VAELERKELEDDVAELERKEVEDDEAEEPEREELDDEAEPEKEQIIDVEEYAEASFAEPKTVPTPELTPEDLRVIGYSVRTQLQQTTNNNRENEHSPTRSTYFSSLSPYNKAVHRSMQWFSPEKIVEIGVIADSDS